MAHLGHSYGTEAETVISLVAGDALLGNRLIDDLPYIRAEVIYACRYEMAMTPYDVLARRTSITLEDRQRGLGILDEVAALMAQELHWSPEQQRALIHTYRSSIEDQMAAEVKA
jgi:glycerol-3-phosphate dehydrogenase